jgi:hypothetical protein
MVNHYFHLPQRHPQQVFFGARFLSQQEIIFSVAQRYEEKATTAKSEEKELTCGSKPWRTSCRLRHS